METMTGTVQPEPAVMRSVPDPTTPAQLLAIVRSVLAVEGVELSVFTGSGVEVRATGDGVADVAATERGVEVVAAGWALQVDAAPVQRAALVTTVSEPLGIRAVGFRLLDHLSQEVLRAWRPAHKEDAGPWRKVAGEHAAEVRTVEVELTRWGGGKRISKELALAVFSDMLASKKVTFDITTGESSAEVFPNVPLHDPHYGQGGWLLAGEPDRKDAHLHVRESQIAGVRFCERTRGEGRTQRVVRIVDAHGYALCDGWFSREATLFGELLERYRGETGIEYEREVPLRS
jgi:hypothetical protein